MAAVFPGIGPCCFEVGPEVAEELAAASPRPGVVDRSRDKPHVDLTTIVVAKLEALALENTKVTGPGLADLKGLTRLRVLNLGRCKVGDDALELPQAAPGFG